MAQATDIENWIASVHLAVPDAEFVSLEPEDGKHALLAAVWLQEGDVYRILSFGNQAFAKPDLVLEMQAHTQDQANEWALALLEFLDDSRPKDDLVSGALFAANKALLDFSPMQGWVLGVAISLETLGLQTSHLHVYPIYQSEIAVCKQVGLVQFLRKMGEELTNPHRLACPAPNTSSEQ